MGFKAVAWGREVKCNTPLTKLVLIILCEYADEKNSCFPSQGYLAEMCGVSDRQIRRSLTWLEEQKLIKVQHRSGTSNRYFVSMDIDVHPPKESDVQTPRTSMSTNNKENKKDINKGQKYKRLKMLGEIQKDFEHKFWVVYPRKIGKKQAQKKYVQLCSSLESSHEDIMKGLDQQLKIWRDNKTEQKFIPHASTWLNQERFRDEFEKESNEDRKMNLSKLWG